MPLREIFDKLDHAYESRPEIFSEVNVRGPYYGDFVKFPAFRVVLTASLEVLKNRVSGREILTEFETEKSL